MLTVSPTGQFDIFCALERCAISIIHEKNMMSTRILLFFVFLSRNVAKPGIIWFTLIRFFGIISRGDVGARE